MKRLVLFLGLLIFVLLPIQTSSLTPNYNLRLSTGQAQQVLPEEKDWKFYYEKSFDYFYNFEYEQALECLEKAKELNPDHPAIYWRLAYIIWFRDALIQKTHLGELYLPRSKDSSSEFKGDKRYLKPSDEFYQIIRKGIEKCGIWLRNNLMDNQKKVEGLFYLGALKAVQVGCEIEMKRGKGVGDWIKIRDTIRNSRENLKDVLNKESSWKYEAYLYLGTFNYTPAICSWKQRLAMIAGFYQWDVVRGLEQLSESVANSTRDDARFYWLYILMFEERNLEALELAGILLKKYPNNIALKGYLVYLCRELKCYDKALELGKEALLEMGSLSLFYTKPVENSIRLILWRIKNIDMQKK